MRFARAAVPRASVEARAKIGVVVLARRVLRTLTTSETPPAFIAASTTPVVERERDADWQTREAGDSTVTS